MLLPSNVSLSVVVTVLMPFIHACFFRKIRKLRHLLTQVETIYVMGLIAIQCYTSIVHTLVFGDRYEFLPLMMTSVYCALGIMYGWLLLMYNHLTAQQ
jgi:alpha-1,3-glucosyltransferase